jgi:hypothetical protein
MPSWLGWHSIEGAANYSKWFSIAGLVAAFFVALFGILAFVYSHRKDALTAMAEASAAEARNKKEQEAARQIAEARKEAHEAQAELENMKEAAAPRHLTDQQKAALAKFLADLPKGRFTIKANVMVKDARGYADEIAEFFANKLGWSVHVDNAIITGPNVAGMWITVRNPNAPPDAAGLLQQAFKAAHMPARAEHDIAGPAPDEVWLSIGSKQ